MSVENQLSSLLERCVITPGPKITIPNISKLMDPIPLPIIIEQNNTQIQVNKIALDQSDLLKQEIISTYKNSLIDSIGRHGGSKNDVLKGDKIKELCIKFGIECKTGSKDDKIKKLLAAILEYESRNQISTVNIIASTQVNFTNQPPITQNIAPNTLETSMYNSNQQIRF